jgi:hypothetical protein
MGPLTGLTGDAQNRPNYPSLLISISIRFKSLSCVLHNLFISFMTEDNGHATDEIVWEQENKIDT